MFTKPIGYQNSPPIRPYTYQRTWSHSLVRKRSVVVGGMKTSISVEDLFWSELRRSAAAKGRRLNDLLAEIEAAMAPGQINLSSAVRLYVLGELLRERNAVTASIAAIEPCPSPPTST